MMLTDRPVVLASASAARKAMLERAGVSVVAQAAAVDEEEIKHSFRAAGLKADEVAEALAELKAQRVSVRHPGHIVLGADQMLENAQFPLHGNRLDELEALIPIRAEERGKARLNSLLGKDGGRPVRPGRHGSRRCQHHPGVG